MSVTTRRAAEIQISASLMKLMQLQIQLQNSGAKANDPQLALIRRNRDALYDMSCRLENSLGHARYSHWEV